MGKVVYSSNFRCWSHVKVLGPFRTVQNEVLRSSGERYFLCRKCGFIIMNSCDTCTDVMNCIL